MFFSIEKRKKKESAIYGSILDPYIAHKSLRQLNFLLDQAPCHKTSAVQVAMQQRPMKSLYIVKRGTNLLQPADVAWMRIFKLQYYEKWQHWMLNEPKSFTPAGNLRSPGYGKAIKWISEYGQRLTVPF